MKKFLIYLFILCFSFVSASAEVPSPDTQSLYSVSNPRVHFSIPDPDKVIIDMEEPYEILCDATYFSPEVAKTFTLSEILVLKITEEVKSVKFNFPTVLTKDQLVINVFSYQEQTLNFGFVTFGRVTNDGGEYVNLQDLPLNTIIVMYVLTGNITDINEP